MNAFTSSSSAQRRNLDEFSRHWKMPQSPANASSSFSNTTRFLDFMPERYHEGWDIRGQGILCGAIVNNFLPMR